MRSSSHTRNNPGQYILVCIIAGILMIMYVIVALRLESTRRTNSTIRCPEKVKDIPHILSEEVFEQMPLHENLGTPQHILENPQFHLVRSKHAQIPFFLLSDENHFPYADGDLAQQKILREIKLAERCKQAPDTIVVDIGSYLGDFGLSAAAMGCKVYMFEPIPFRTWLINTSIAINNFGDRVKLFNKAISPKKTILKFSFLEASSVQIPEDQEHLYQSVLEVHAVSLDNIFPVERIFMLKVDVEGFEPTVLFGACKNILKEKRVDYLISEYTAFWNNEGRGPWDTFLPKLNTLIEPSGKLFALHRREPVVFGPLEKQVLDIFLTRHLAGKLQTDILVDFHGNYTADLPWNPTSLG